MARNPRAAEILNKVFADKNNVCFNNMDEAVEAIETSTKLFENAGTEMKQLIKNVKEFEKFTDAPSRPPQYAQSARLSWRHIFEICKIGDTFKEI